MEALKKIGLLHKAFVSQSKALALFLPLLLLLVLALSHWEALMPTIWHAFSGFFEGPALAFLLLNCLILTIIASSKLEREKGRHEEEKEEEANKRESIWKNMEKGRESIWKNMEKGDEKGDFIAENGCVEQINHNISSYEYNLHEGKSFVGIKSYSFNVNYKEQIKIKEPINHIIVNEKKPNKLLAEGLLLIPNKPLSDLKEKQLMRGSFSFNDRGGSHAKPVLRKPHKSKGLRRPGNIFDHPARQAEEAASSAAMVAHPSSEDVWAAIMLTKKSDDRMANYMHTGDRTLATAAARSPPPLSTVTPRPPAAAAAAATAAAAPPPPAGGRTSPAPAHTRPAPAPAPARTPPAPEHTPPAPAPAPAPARARTPPAAATAAANPLRAVQAAPNPPAAAIEKHEDATDHEHDSELEELNRRAEEFIARFNHQMCLQRQESWQRKTRSRPCNPCSNHVQLQTPGLLVG